MAQLATILRSEPTEGPSPTSGPTSSADPLSPTTTGPSSPESLSTLEEPTPTATVTETVTASPEPVTTCAGTSADPCVVDLSQAISVPLWTSFGLCLLLLAAILASQLRRP